MNESYPFVVPSDDLRAHLVARKHGDLAQELEVRACIRWEYQKGGQGMTTTQDIPASATTPPASTREGNIFKTLFDRTISSTYFRATVNEP